MDIPLETSLTILLLSIMSEGWPTLAFCVAVRDNSPRIDPGDWMSLTPSTPGPEFLLDQARRGRTESLGALLELYRNYLQLVARTEIDRS